jgi:hypothetical protein
VTTRRALVSFLAALSLSACVNAPVDEISPSFETLKLLRAESIPPLALGGFADSPQAKIGRSINIRGSTLRAPKNGTFADFLKQTVQTELVAAGVFNPTAATSLEGVLTESRAGENLSSGGASLAAEFRVRRNGELVFSKPFRVETSWKSDFIGAIAIPEAFRQYNGLYALLVRRALSDPELIAALRQ